MAPFISQMMSKELCYRCGKPVYPTDKVGPLKDGAFFHQGCFKCYLCGTRLALKTYCNNRKANDDREVYCRNHVPNATPHDPTLPLPPSPSNGVEPNACQQHQQMRRHRHNADAGLHDMKIAHAMKVTQAVKPYPKIKHGGAKYIVDYDTQTRLELLHRQDEDKLYQEFDEHRQKEIQQFEEETREEWEKALAEFARRYEQRHATAREKEQLLNDLTLRKERKLETITSKRKERERMRTAELVDQQAKEMMELFRQARSQHQNQQHQKEQRECDVEETTSSCSGGMPSYPSTPPPPMPPSCSKRHIYTDTVVFQQIDQVAVSVANQDLHSFTELIRTLIAGARCDVDKARAIYRWITVKNLNVMNFDNDLDKDTPMGLLRGIKYGTESYHVLFKRLCSYAGLHCVVIKGFSKSAGYQPGLGFDDSRFRNTWNAVFLDGSWRFVQCNWGARHLVNAKENAGGKRSMTAQNGHEKDGNGAVGSNLRYEYDDHYFMTDPEEMIYEFFPDESQWQLLPRPVSLKQFEQFPFVRSLFFRYGLRFSDPRLSAVVRADKTGAVSIAIALGAEAMDSLIFHYNLRSFDTEDAELDGGLSLKRFVMQSSLDDSVVFRVHVPTTRPLLLDIFANCVSSEHYLTGQPIKFKSVCKFKIECDSLRHIMVPLPECASGEWGPSKAFRLFGLVPRTHEEPIINCDQYCEIRFKVTKPLTEMVANLHRNGMESRHLQKCVHCSLDDEEVAIELAFPDEGQYGLDIYTRDAHQRNGTNGRQMLTHCCKYLINARVD